jgi:MFS family permease
MFGLAAPLGRLADRVGRRRMLLVGTLGTIAGALGTSLSGESILILPFFFLLGLGWSACWVAGTAVLADVTSPVERGRLIATNDQIVALSAAAAVLAAGPVLDIAGFPAVGIALAVLMTFALIPVWRLRESEPGRYTRVAIAAD